MMQKECLVEGNADVCDSDGEDKPLKYPSIFHTADAAIVTKMDLAVAVEFDDVAARRNIQAVRPGIPIFQSSVKTNTGFDEIMRWIKSLVVYAAS